MEVGSGPKVVDEAWGSSEGAIWRFGDGEAEGDLLRPGIKERS